MKHYEELGARNQMISFTKFCVEISTKFRKHCLIFRVIALSQYQQKEQNA